MQLVVDMGLVKTEMALVKTDVSSLKTDMALVKTDVSSLKTDMALVKTNLGIETARPSAAQHPALAPPSGGSPGAAAQ